MDAMIRQKTFFFAHLHFLWVVLQPLASRFSGIVVAWAFRTCLLVVRTRPVREPAVH